MSLPVGVLLAERVPQRIVTPLGIRFRDIALDEAITHGLVVMVKAKLFNGAPTRVYTNPSGVFGFHSLPLLHDFEYPSTTASLSSPPQSYTYVVMATDPLTRFLPAVFGIELPLSLPPSPPVFDTDPDPAPLLDAYLFTAPTRAVTCGFAAVRTDLWDRETETPAAHALARATVGGRSVLGTADERGRLLILLPYPLLEQLRLGSPPGTGQQPPFEHTWPISLEVFYTPGLPRPFGEAAVLPQPWTALPSLKGILEAQDPAWVWATPVGPPALTWTGMLTFDHELTVRTTTVSELWISRGPSPP